MNEIHESAEASAKANMAIVGKQPSADLAAACEHHVLQNHVAETLRSNWKRSSSFRTSLPFVTAQVLAHSGQPELGKKLISYYAKFEGKNAVGLPASMTGVCFFRVENGQARFETSCRTGSKCPYPHHVPWYEE